MRHVPGVTALLSQPLAGLQVSTVQLTPSLQLVSPRHVPAPSQVLDAEHALPSSHTVVDAAFDQPVADLLGSHTRHSLLGFLVNAAKH